MQNSSHVMDYLPNRLNGQTGLLPVLPSPKLPMPTLNEVRELQRKIAKVDAFLTPLAADGAGFDAHGGSIPHVDAKLAKCIKELQEAADMAKRMGICVVTA